MKKFSAVLVSLAVIFTLGSCNPKKTINDATTFTIDYNTEVDVPAVTLTVTGTQEYITPDVPTTSKTRYLTEGTTPALVDKISMTRFNVSSTNGNFDFVKSIDLILQADGLSEVSVASKSSIPAGSNKIECDLSGANIKDYIAKDNFKLKAKVTVDSLQTTDTKLKFELSVKVEAKKL